MAFTPGSNEGDLTGTTAVVAVASPAASTQRQISQLVVYNADSVSRTIDVIYNDGTNSRVIHQAELLRNESLTVGGFVLDDTNSTLEVKSDAIATTTEPTFVATFADLS